MNHTFYSKKNLEPAGTTKMRVYTRIKGKLAVFNVDTADTGEAIKTVRDEVGLRHKSVILALVEGKKSTLADTA